MQQSFYTEMVDRKADATQSRLKALTPPQIHETTAAVTGAYQFLLGKFAFPMFGNFFRTELATSAGTSAGRAAASQHTSVAINGLRRTTAV